MTFAKRVRRQEVVSNFFKICKEDNCGIEQMTQRLKNLKENKEEFPHIDTKTINLIAKRMDSFDKCPSCGNDFMYEGELKYCPLCD